MITAILVLARSIHIGSAMLLVALPYFINIMTGSHFNQENATRLASFFRSVLHLWWIALMAEALSGAVWFWFVTAQMTDQSPTLSDLETVLGQTQFGQLWLIRTVMFMALGLALLYETRHQHYFSSRFNWLMLSLGSGLLISLAWAGHAVSGLHFQVLHLLADALHLELGAIWPMGLIPVLLFLGNLHGQEPARFIQEDLTTLKAFSNNSFRVVGLLVITGCVNAWLMMGSWEALVTTLYGNLLIGKIVLVGVMVGLGCYNRFVLIPQIHPTPGTFHQLRRTVLVESALMVAVLLLVGTMGMTTPPS